jgi:hypothetical protein
MIAANTSVASGGDRIALPFLVVPKTIPNRVFGVGAQREGGVVDEGFGKADAANGPRYEVRDRRYGP